jgi:hypothetical protein
MEDASEHRLPYSERSNTRPSHDQTDPVYRCPERRRCKLCACRGSASSMES